MSEYIEAILEGIEDGLKIFQRIQKISKQVEKLVPKEVYTDSSLYKGKVDNVGETPRTPHNHVSGSGLAIDMEQDSKGVYRTKEEISDVK